MPVVAHRPLAVPRLPASVPAWPLLAVRTYHSRLEGARSPADWGQALAALPVPRLLLADRDDLCALPAALASWGRERLAVGTTVRWRGDDLVLMAPTAAAYRALCRLLTARHHDPAGWDAGPLPEPATELIALVRAPAAVAAWRAAGAEVWWRSGAVPDDGPGCCPAAAVAELNGIGPEDGAGAPVRARLRARAGQEAGPEAGLDGLEAMLAAYAARPDLVAAADALIRRCAHVPDTGWRMPPSLHPDPAGELARRALAGARARYGDPLPPAVAERLRHELHVIAAKDFCGYILTVADLVGGRRTCGRGSGASSLVVYCLGITNVDPVRWNLLFERFLAPSRSDPPDLDIDFPWDERDAVLAEAMRRHGRERVAAVANHLHFAPRGALRAVALAAGLDGDAIGAARRRLDAQARYGEPAGLGAPWAALGEAAAQLAGAPHHLGLHCGGIVITGGPIADFAPLHPSAKTVGGRPLPVLPWEKDGTEAMGLVKIDLLGNRALAVVRDSLADLAALGIAIDEARWRPADDPLARDLVARGDTLGCFYIESPAMRQLQAKAGSGDFDRLVVHSSIIRPAASGWIDTYLARLHEHRRSGRHDPAWYPHPALRGLLSESFGVLSYQEDVMLAAQRLAGFDDARANALRKALGQWGTGSRLTSFAGEFRDGCAANGVDAVVAQQVWEMIASFSGYSFCKAHSASYAMVSFQCAWLKAHHPGVFLARVIANEGGFYGPGAYLEDARRRGVAIRGPCVQASAWATAPEDAGAAIRCGLHLIPGLGRPAAERIVRERARQPFVGIADLRRRCALDAARLETLLAAGALDVLAPGANHAQRAWIVSSLAAQAPPRLREGPPDEQWIDLGMARAPDADPEPPPLPARDPRPARLHALGFLPEHHPILLAGRLPNRVPAARLSPAMRGRAATVVGIPITRKQVDATAADGSRRAMSFVTCEDETGLIETVWFPDAYRAWGPLLERGAPLRLDGRVQESFGVVTLEVRAAAELG
jgi:DNA polymerase III alpha subunit